MTEIEYAAKIEEMARDICPYKNEYVNCKQCDTELDIGEYPCCYKSFAKQLYEKDYRKIERGEWITLNWGRRLYCSRCKYPKPYKKLKAGYHVLDKGKFCPNCGLDMRGGKDENGKTTV